MGKYDRRLTTNLPWLKCPLCGRFMFRYRVVSETYKCSICGCDFTADFSTSTVSQIKPTEDVKAVKEQPLAAPKKKQKSKSR